MNPNEPSTVVLDVVASVTSGIPVYYAVPAVADRETGLVPMTAPPSLLDVLSRVQLAAQPYLHAAKAGRVGQLAFASLRGALTGFGTRSRRSAKQLR